MRVHWSGYIVEQALVVQSAARRDGDEKCHNVTPYTNMTNTIIL